MLTTDMKPHTTTKKETGNPTRVPTLQKRNVNRTGMPDNLKNGIENLSGLNMDQVRVHYNSPRPAQLQALAYAQGTDIHIAPRQEKHLPHEAWHVVQQMQGRVRPTMQLHNTAINDNPALEREADVMGNTALHGKTLSKPAQLKRMNGTPCVQRVPGDLSCEASVSYSNAKSTQATGYNDYYSRGSVLSVFSDYHLTKLAAIPKKTNDPGMCAEPHAVAKALQKAKTTARVKAIHVSPARFTTRCKNRVAESILTDPAPDHTDMNFARALLGHKPTPRNAKHAHKIRNSNATYPPCATCAQWIGNDGYVKSDYLK